MNAEANPRPSTQHMLEVLDNPDMKPKPTLVEPEVMPRKPISERRLAANRANALKSTGPHSKAGKEIVRVNAITHGLYATVLPKNKAPGLVDPRMLGQLIQQYQEDFKPKTQLEMTLVESLAVDMLRLRQIHAMEARFFEDVFEETPMDRNRTTSSYTEFPDGKNEELVQRELALAEQLHQTLEAGPPLPLTPEDAELLAKCVYDQALSAERTLEQWRKQLEELRCDQPPEPVPAPVQGEPSPVPPVQPKSANDQQADSSANIARHRAMVQKQIQKFEQETLDALGVSSLESVAALLQAGTPPPEERRAAWLATMRGIQSTARSILRGVANEQQRQEDRRAQANRNALSMTPRLDQLSRYESMVRRNIERTLKQLGWVRHELFA